MEIKIEKIFNNKKMTVPQQKIREVVFQLLYGHDWLTVREEALHSLISKEVKVSKKVVIEAQRRVRDIRTHLKELDQIIASSSKSYKLERIPKTERNILRLAAFEILFDDTVPPKVAIAEAIRLGRKFSTPESASFINAVLDEIYHNHKLSNNSSNTQSCENE